MEVEQQRPYHIKAIYDLKENFSTQRFRDEIGECRKVVALAITADQSAHQETAQHIARVHIFRYLDLQLSRAMTWAEGEADLLAIVLRSQIELRGWAEFVSESSEQATRFLNDEVAIDADELTEKMRKAFPGITTSFPSSPKGKRVDPPRIGQSVDYDFKLCSKLIHPSALTLNHPEASIRNERNKEYLAIQVLLYGWVIVNRFHDLNWVP